MRFPVLCIPIDASVFLALTPKQLATTRVSKPWTDRIINGMQIVDSSESCFIVRSYSEEKPRTTVLRKLAQILELKRELKLQIEQTPPLAVSAVKEAVVRSLTEDPEGFEESSGMDADWWLRELNQVSSYRDVIALFAKAAGAA